MRFEGTSAYVATDDLKVAVNAAIALERPLLVKGEPGTGKTVLALEIAKAVGFAADRMAHQVHHQGAAGIVRVRRSVAAARQPAR
jgi:MoxR-like ATPase